MRRYLALAVVTVSILAAVPAAASPGGSGPAPHAQAAVTFVLLGDTPYGDDQRAIFPALVNAINVDDKVRFVLHAGDVKNGSSTCDDARFADLAALYTTFADPFVLYEVEPGYAGVPNLTRLETFGATATRWLKVTADPRAPEVFSWEPMTVS
ncbi:MAG TPA: hypothetical protein VFC19_24475 [Candidatus Limnocylindrales bacterium]|nr:hypothetical protein [Candidatus Limnocylindrales bacterium]